MASRHSEFIGRKEVDHYELKVKTNDGWQNPEEIGPQFETSLETIDDFDEPLDRAVVENNAESEGWPAGTYAMVARGLDGTVIDYVWQGLEIERAEPSGSKAELTDVEE